MTARPFRAPHHTASSVALIGGGTSPRPGEVTLSHRGILFLDELPEFPRAVLEVLRQPLEDGHVTVSRAARSVTFPAQFMLVATAIPCPCGYLGDGYQPCTCRPAEIQRYARRLSGPFLDRIDLVVDVPRVRSDALVARRPAESTALIAGRVASARQTQRLRYHDVRGITYNAQLSSSEVARFCALDAATQRLAKVARDNLGLSARAYTRMLKVARTIADLASCQAIAASHVTEALSYRPRVKA